jgi:hypothetical protein
MALFALGRILGNELPPRDRYGGRLAALEALLESEPVLPYAKKFWVINRVWDLVLAETYNRRLADTMDPVYIMPFEEDRYFEADARGQRLLYCPGINGARNKALHIAFEDPEVQFAAIFDGDCGFSSGQWRQVLDQMTDDTDDGIYRMSYSVPMIRTDYEGWKLLTYGRTSEAPGPVDEPQLIISRKGWDEGLQYNEGLPFGHYDKLGLLMWLGHSSHQGHWHEITPNEKCRSVGACCHIGTGRIEVEHSLDKAKAARQDALERLHTDIVRRYRSEA